MEINFELINNMRKIFNNHHIDMTKNDHSDEYKAYKEIEQCFKNRILTCVYCGKIYPEGTPTHGSQILTDHIKVCEKHPLRKAEKKIKLLQEALFDILDMNEKEELIAWELKLNSHPNNNNKEKMLNAIHALLETLEE